MIASVIGVVDIQAAELNLDRLVRFGVEIKLTHVKISLPGPGAPTRRIQSVVNAGPVAIVRKDRVLCLLIKLETKLCQTYCALFEPWLCCRFRRVIPHCGQIARSRTIARPSLRSSAARPQSHLLRPEKRHWGRRLRIANCSKNKDRKMIATCFMKSIVPNRFPKSQCCLYLEIKEFDEEFLRRCYSIVVLGRGADACFGGL